MDTFDQIPASGLSRIHMDPEPPVPGIPEPETYALMLAGLALVGAAARRRRQ